MAYTLISFIGRGSKGIYDKTTYEFANGEKFETRLFMSTILTCKMYKIDKIILAGTRTSSWSTVIKDTNENSEIDELWTDVSSECDDEYGLTDETRKKLELYLSEQYKIPVVIKTHIPTIDKDTSEEIFNTYKSIEKEIDDASDILFDITHSFRSMPILMYQTLQFVFANQLGRKVELIYGEYKPNSISPVRNLSPYWELAQASDAISVFKTKLDGTKLAEMMEAYWKDGAKVIKRISDTVQTNFSLQIVETIRNIKNVLKNYPENMPSWVAEVKQEMEEFVKLLDETSQAKTLYKYAQFLYEKHLNTQAIITMQVAAETAIAEKYGDENKVGDYDWWQETGKNSLRNIKYNDSKMQKSLGNLERFRNQIAHGGAKNRDTGGFPKAENMSSIYESGKKGVEMLFEYLEKN